LNTEFKSFASEVFLPVLPTVGLTKWALEKIQISPEFALFWNVETDASSWFPQNLMHKQQKWGFTLAWRATVSKWIS
jgi:hypothetical protein